jgi:hypothetical protein
MKSPSQPHWPGSGSSHQGFAFCQELRTKLRFLEKEYYYRQYNGGPSNSGFVELFFHKEQ